MKRLNFISAVFISALALGCKSDQNKIIEETVSQDSSSLVAPRTYAEISIAQGGNWTDGSRGHKEYSGRTGFKNVESIKVPDLQTDHTYYFRYEGPGWESNKIGYRLYLDWRNAIDIFGKVTDSLVLAKVGQDGFDSYHKKQWWGMDILKVGKGLGIGALGRLVDEEVLHFKEVDSTFASVKNSLEQSSVSVKYYGWTTASETIDLHSTFSILPDQRITKHTFIPSKAIEGIVTGIVNHDVNYFQKKSTNKKWAYIATYGEQTLVPDKLGMAIFYEIETTSQLKKGEFDYLIEFKPTTKPVSFYFLAAWEQEPNGITTEEEFISHLDELLESIWK